MNTNYSHSDQSETDQREDPYALYAQLVERLGTISFYVIALQCIIGLTGNSVALAVWISGKKSSKLASSTYFKFLAGSDVFSLIYRVFDVLGRPPVNASFMGSDEMCPIDAFLFYFAPQLSTWIIVCLSIERMLSLCFPLKFNTKGSPKRAKIAFVAILVVIVPPNVIRSLRCEIYKIPVQDIYDLYTEVMKLSVIYLLCVLPFFIITACNVVSVVNICIQRKIGASDAGRRQIATKLTKLSISIGVLQCVSILPGMLYNINLFHRLYFLPFDYEGLVTFQYICDMVLYLNNTFDFLLYSFSSEDFRKDCKDLLCCKR